MNDYYTGQRVKRSLVTFLFGKLGSGILGFLAFALVARLLEREEFGALVASMAFVEILIGLSTFGVDWAAAIWLPSYRIHAAPAVFWRFVGRMIALRAVFLVLAALLALAFAEWIAGFVGLGEWIWVFRCYLLVACLDGMLRYLKDTVMDSLLMQGANQLSICLKNFCTVVVLSLGAAGYYVVDLRLVVQVEIVTFSLALAVVTIALLFARARDRRAPPMVPNDWREPTASQLFAVARHNYLTSLAQIAAAPNVFVLGIERFLGLGTTAVFGFARMLSDQIRKYLPSELFFGMIRTMIIATYARTGDMRELALHHSVLLKLGLFPITLLVGVLIAHGDPMIQWVGGDKYAGVEWLVLSFMVLLSLVVLKRNLELFLNTSRHTDLMLRSSLAALAGIPIGFGALAAGGNLYHVVAALAIGEVLVIWCVLIGLWRRGIHYRISFVGIAKLFVPAIAIGLAARLLSSAGNVYLVLGEAIILCLMITLVQGFMAPLSDDERHRLRRIVRSLRERGGSSSSAPAGA
ncbi:MAG: hypothetical protein WCZ28_07555 [Burkholderiaceae bacterium]